MGGTTAQALHRLRLDIQSSDTGADGERRLSTKIDALVNQLEAKLSDLSTTTREVGATTVERSILRNIALDVASLRWPVPRLACLLPPHDESLSEQSRQLQDWSSRLESWCKHGKRKGKGISRRKLRLFFLCAHDFSLAECGPDGQGYEVTELLNWVKRARPVAKIGLALGRIALTICTGLSLPPQSISAAFDGTVGGAVSEIVREGSTVAGELLSARGVDSSPTGDTDDTVTDTLELVRTAPKVWLGPDIGLLETASWTHF